MSATNHKVARLTKYNIVTAENASGEYWFVKAGYQDTFGGTLAAGTTTAIGPYAEDAEIRIQADAGSITIDKANSSAPTPIAFAANPSAAVAALEALEPEAELADVITAHNALLAALQG